MYDLAVYIGRFQPFHYGHQLVLNEAFQIAKHAVVLVGSSYKARKVKNPFTFGERMQMITEAAPVLPVPDRKLSVQGIVDFDYSNYHWISQVQSIVTNLCNKWDCDPTKIVLIGPEKDMSSFYLKLFPEWARHHTKVHRNINGTDIRKMYFNGHLGFEIEDVVPKTTMDFLRAFQKTEEYERLCGEQAHELKEQGKFKTYPYPESLVFVTVDAVLINMGHVLVVKRKTHPGKGLWALPGGFLESREWITDGIIRELREETEIRMSEVALKNALQTIRHFDAPNRSSRGRVITFAGLFMLHSPTFPIVKGSDDAETAKWMPISEARLHPEWFFDDHHSIITSMLQIADDRPGRI